MNVVSLDVEPLDPEHFEPFGEVIEIGGASSTFINDGTAQRFSNLANIDVGFRSGSAALHIYRARPRPHPIRIAAMERHPLGSQAFVSLDRHPFIVVVSPDDAGQPGRPRVFAASESQGVNIKRNTWHHPLLVLRNPSHFLVLDRNGPGDNLEEQAFKDARYAITLPDNLTPPA